MAEFVIFSVLQLKKKQRKNFTKASETNILKFIGGLDKVFIIPPPFFNIITNGHSNNAMNYLKI